jgi:phosphoglycerate dehydrogenase-like enzyme
MQTADVIVVELGAIGSSMACRSTRRGTDVIGLDRFSPKRLHSAIAPGAAA